MIARAADAALLESAFKRYYFENFGSVRAPARAREREFGYQRFGSPGMSRHISVRDDRELRLLLMGNAPSDVYCSNGLYSFPDLPMAEKDWKGADLIFDIDAKDLGLGCRPGHSCSRCGGCGRAFGGAPPCPHCGSGRAETRSLPCRDCLGAARAEVGKLRRILVDDLGAPPGSIHVYFSGNEGFHVHVPGSGYEGLGARERTELSHYVMFRNAIPESMGMPRPGGGRAPDRRAFPEIGEGGWRGRAAKELFGSKSARSKAISGIIAGGYAAFQERLAEISPRIGAVIDPNVTADVHRIFRLEGTLNGKSGMAKTACGPDPSRFDPQRDAGLLRGPDVEVSADCPARLVLGGRRFGPYGPGERVVLPEYAAAYLICKGFATSA